MNAREIGLRQVDAAAIAEFSERTGQRIEAGEHQPNRGRVRDWRSSAAPLAGVWENELEPMLRQQPRLRVGANQHGIAEQLSALKRKLDPTWIAFNYHQFSAFTLAEALIAVRTPAVGDHRKLVVVEDCNFSNQTQFGERQLEMLQVIDRIPDTTLLIFIAASIDKRLKVVKHLLKHGQLKEFPLIPPWRSDLIAQAISKAAARLNATQDKVAKLVLSRECVNYLAGAISNDLTRVDSELRKLKVYAQGKRLTKAEVEALVPCQTQNTVMTP